jgi:hypothetical protein
VTGNAEIISRGLESRDLVRGTVPPGPEIFADRQIFITVFFRGSTTTSIVTCGFSRSYNQAKPQGGKKHRGLVAPRLDHDMKAIFKSADRFRTKLCELCAKPCGEI